MDDACHLVHAIRLAWCMPLTWHGGTSWDSRQVRHGSIHMRICARGGRGIPLHHPSSHMDHGMFLVRMLVRSLQSIECAALTNTHTLLFDVSSDPHSGKMPGVCLRGEHVECCPEDAVKPGKVHKLRRIGASDRTVRECCVETDDGTQQPRRSAQRGATL